MTLNRRNLLLYAGAASAVVVTGCSTSSGGGGSDGAAKRREVDTAVDTALSQLYASVPGSRELAANARGVLIFPKIVSAGFVVGGSYGEGALRKSGGHAGYYRVTGASVGFLAGAESHALYLLFMTVDAMNKFEASSGWTAGADASVVMARTGAEREHRHRDRAGTDHRLHAVQCRPDGQPQRRRHEVHQDRALSQRTWRQRPGPSPAPAGAAAPSTATASRRQAGQAQNAATRSIIQ